MSEGFLGRWSRRKLGRAEAAPVVAEPEGVPELPALESLGGASDYRAFLHRGVAAGVQAVALRRAWESDPAIAEFRGMADYDWDFNAPSYGRLWAADDVGKLVEAVLSLPGEPEVVVEVEVVEVVSVVVPVVAAPVAEASPAADEDVIVAVVPRRHGGALPC